MHRYVSKGNKPSVYTNTVVPSHPMLIEESFIMSELQGQ